MKLVLVLHPVLRRAAFHFVGSCRTYTKAELLGSWTQSSLIFQGKMSVLLILRMLILWSYKVFYILCVHREILAWCILYRGNVEHGLKSIFQVTGGWIFSFWRWLRTCEWRSQPEWSLDLMFTNIGAKIQRTLNFIYMALFWKETLQSASHRCTEIKKNKKKQLET